MINRKTHRFIGVRHILSWLLAVVFVLSLPIDLKGAYAQTDPTYKYTAETEGIKAFVVQITTSLNVRQAAGRTNKQIKHPVTNETVSLRTGDLVAVMSEVTVVYEDDTSALWYEVRWVSDEDIEFHGYINAAYTIKTGDPAIPLPTPTPSSKNTPTPKPTSAAGPTNTPTPKPTATPMAAPPKMGDNLDAGAGIKAVLIVIAVLVLLVGIYMGYTALMKNNKIARRRTYNNKMRQVNRQFEQNMMNNQSFAGYRETEANVLPVDREALRTQKETDIIRKELNNLKVNDIVVHKFFGQGTVVGYNDEENLLIRFGEEIRSINIENAAVKQVLRQVK